MSGYNPKNIPKATVDNDGRPQTKVVLPPNCVMRRGVVTNRTDVSNGHLDLVYKLDNRKINFDDHDKKIDLMFEENKTKTAEADCVFLKKLTQKAKVKVQQVATNADTVREVLEIENRKDSFVEHKQNDEKIDRLTDENMSKYVMRRAIVTNQTNISNEHLDRVYTLDNLKVNFNDQDKKIDFLLEEKKIKTAEADRASSKKLKQKAMVKVQQVATNADTLREVLEIESRQKKKIEHKKNDKKIERITEQNMKKVLESDLFVKEKQKQEADIRAEKFAAIMANHKSCHNLTTAEIWAEFDSLEC